MVRVGGGVKGDIRRRRPVAVQIQADGVQLRQGGNLNQVVPIAVVALAMGFGLKVHPVQARVVVRRAEYPGIVVRGAIPVNVQIIPVGVDAGVADGREQLAGRLMPRAETEQQRIAEVPQRRGAHRVGLSLRVDIRVGVHSGGVRLQGRDLGVQPRQHIAAGSAGNLPVPVAVLNRARIAARQAHTFIGAPDGVAGLDDALVEAHQAAGGGRSGHLGPRVASRLPRPVGILLAVGRQPVVLRADGRRRVRIGPGCQHGGVLAHNPLLSVGQNHRYRGAPVEAHQGAHRHGAIHRAGAVSGCHRAVVDAHQRAHIGMAGNIGVG